MAAPLNSPVDVEPWASDVRFVLIAPKEAASFRAALLRWYREHGRDLPWRRTRDPYAILVSEFMLQQTQVATVLPYYSEWLRRFPDFATLATAPESDVLHAWQGLGYYARARNLHATAKIIMSEHGGEFPHSAIAARQLPGLGRYTTNAVACFAFGDSVPLVEANIARVFARLTDLQIPVDSGPGSHLVWQLAADLAPARNAAEYQSALMDLGALTCLPRQPQCTRCPVKTFCRAKTPAALPIKRPRLPTKLLKEYHSFAARGSRVLLEQSVDRWRGMWILPRLADVPHSQPLHSSEFPFTHHRVTLAVFKRPATCRTTARQRWFPIRAIESLPMPSPHRRALASLLPIQPAREHIRSWTSGAGHSTFAL